MILDLFAGIGGWSEGLRSLGRGDELGVEVASDPCRTRHAAGFVTVEADVTQVDPCQYAGRVEGITASPPCQTFSLAGSGDGRSALGHLRSVLLLDAPLDPDLDPRTRLVVEVLRWVEAIRPRWIALEQTALVAPLWEACALRLARQGWKVWTDVVDAAFYGVPQHRQRACLLASRDRRVVRPLMQLHGPQTMAEALGWTFVPHERRNDQSQSGEVDPDWPLRRPATTIAKRLLVTDPGTNANRFSPEVRKSRNDGYRITLSEALILQGFRPDYPVQGHATSQALQVGNAIPPPLAAALLGQVL